MSQNKTTPHSLENNFELDPRLRMDTIICKVEIDLADWLADLSGWKGWEVASNDEFENYVTFFLKNKNHFAEITLFNSGFAQAELNGEVVFYGDLLLIRNESARMNYYALQSGEKVTMH